MDYVALVKSPLWKELWEDRIISDKMEAVRNQLLNTAVAEPHTLGELRGQIKALQWLKTTVESLADQQMKIAAGAVAMPEESASRIQWLRKRHI